MDWLTTSTILDRLRDNRDDAMWLQFNDRFRLPLVRFAAKMGLSDDLAEDVAQETLLAFCEGYREGKYDRTQGRLSSWLFGIAYRQAANAVRKRARDRAKRDPRAADPEFLAEVPAEAEATQVWDREWQEAAVARCLGLLRSEVQEHTYEAFHRVVYSGQAVEQVARDLEMSANQVYVAKHRCLKRLGELVRELTEWE
jgi:RNA polymerase sigma factor (sigma-70 family)